MTILSGTLLVVGAILVLAALCWGIRWLEREVPLERYDERQNLARGNAYRISFWVGMVWYVATIFCVMSEAMPVDGWLLIFVGLMLQIMVFHIYCLLSSAALPLSQKPVPTIIIYCIFGAGQAMDVCFYASSLGTPLTGRGSNVWAHLVGAVCFFSLAIMHLISLLWKEKE